ncbi:MAG: sigma 54-interacting transcriptional regulator [Planctomycetes bacterium]|nr:sigma 54-interacting transcriptional regulator [Planctomycetota bacterium]
MKSSQVSTDLLLDVWKDVGRHDEIGESLQRLALRLARELPVRRLVVRRMDEAAQRLDTVATAELHEKRESPLGRAVLASDELLRLVDWARRGRVVGWRSGARDPLREVLEPPGYDEALLAGPLVEQGRAVGALLVHGRSDDLLAHAPLIEALLEPLAVALSNDFRLLEIARLREAAEADNRALLSRLQREDISDSVVGQATGLRVVMERVEQVARTDAPVLILGETGSGKEVVARAIHARSRRADGPFLRVNCGAIPPELVDSELFGHERGSFTGAVNTRRGWFERADGGTLFLDELGELPAAAQVRLLRVLQDGTFERVGGQRSLHVDVRIVAATHRDMQLLVNDGKFRQDLWYRINVFPIGLPPLRERAEDVAALAGHFAARAGRRLFGVELVPSERDIEHLRAYDWPGNVRELASVIERAAILGDGRRLDVAAALGVEPSRSATTSNSLDAAGVQVPSNAPQPATPASLERAMAEHIVDALKRTQGRIEGARGAAALLDINPHTLRSRMRKLGIEWARFRDLEP